VLTLHFHPLASFCWKALIALYENRTRFTPHVVDLGNEAERTAFLKLSPLGKMPVLRDEARGCTVAESTIVVEYLDSFYPGTARFIPADAEAAWHVRMWDRFYDLYVQLPMQKIVTDRLRPGADSDAYGVERAKADLREAYTIVEQHLGSNENAAGGEFTLADCAACPALFYADTVLPFAATDKHLSAYLDRLMARPSFARVLREAEPYFANFPLETKPRIARSGP
jgi:glutathione S-transferase